MKTFSDYERMKAAKIILDHLYYIRNKPKQMKKTWCKHIRWEPPQKYHHFNIRGAWLFYQDVNGQSQVPRSWKCCPICLTLRPFRKKLKPGDYQTKIVQITYAKKKGKLLNVTHKII